jgi:hypothetical protein
VIFEIGNVASVDNSPRKGSKFELDAPHVITLIQTYHWNGGRGAPPGSIGLSCRDNLSFGPWPATGSPGQGGAPNAYWTARPNVTVPATTCVVVDSDSATWAHNGGSGNRGFVRIEGYAVGGMTTGQSVNMPPASSGNATVDKIDEGLRRADETLNKINRILDIFK